MKKILQQLIHHEPLEKQQARNVLVAISEGNYPASQIAAFITVYMMRHITLEELEGFRDALLDLCVQVSFDACETIDLCGTGGDGKNTFNISTLASFITAGAGVPVTKHGNYGVSSISGSSNVMEELGIPFSNDNDFLKQCLDTAGIAILHAPLFHPAMKNVGPIRKELGVKTFFNMLGPMVNPAFPKHQLVGVFSLELARLYGYLYQKGDKQYTILHALDGYDEVSLTGPVKRISNRFDDMLLPAHFKSERLSPETLYGGATISESAQLFSTILKAEGTEAQHKVVCANAALAIATATGCSLETGVEKAEDSLFNRKGWNALEQLQKMAQS
ncbi:anthranilate phosphoribosyltransferase [Altibacter sp. HG106]|uniref:anthranilate phosphoribosyltransferase n=1 Tax=Altibacter sp. HG106 TaxID=3023937 RepID=UPI00234FFF69|nr:anthranilate phosphoribosyltransferase [Altibacter sp. HG106]MDC7996161.1 anthranilate phosphoribosyltransferase [Altibacter sp. HG106]